MVPIPKLPLTRTPNARTDPEFSFRISINNRRVGVGGVESKRLKIIVFESNMKEKDVEKTIIITLDSKEITRESEDEILRRIRKEKGFEMGAICHHFQ